MKKSELKQLINEIVREAINELSGEQVSDSLSRILNERAINEVKVLTNYGSFELEIVEVWESKGVLYLGVNADRPPQIEEGLETDSASAANPTVGAPKTSSERDQQELQKYQQKLAKVTTDIKTAESNIAKREDAVQKANKKDELKKQQLTKQQGPIIKKMDQIKKKISTYFPEQAQNDQV